MTWSARLLQMSAWSELRSLHCSAMSKTKSMLRTERDAVDTRGAARRRRRMTAESHLEGARCNGLTRTLVIEPSSSKGVGRDDLDWQALRSRRPYTGTLV